MFSQRSHKKELLDQEEIPAADLEKNLMELHTINKYLGGYRVSRKGIEKAVKGTDSAIVLDIGCGGGDTLNALYEWSLRNRCSVQLNGIDVKPVCVACCERKISGKPGIRVVCDDYRNSTSHFRQVDVLHASLFCHHLSNDEITSLIRFAIANKMTLVVNDLQRHPLAYFSIKTLTGLFSRSYLVRNDAPLSVLRGFTRKEWQSLLEEAGAKNYTITGRWAFRHEVIVYHE